MQVLKPCPFCGGKARLKKGDIYGTTGYRVSCVLCGVSTTLIFVDHPALDHTGKVQEKTRYTAEQAKDKAAKAWNRRATDDER